MFYSVFHGYGSRWVSCIDCGIPGLWIARSAACGRAKLKVMLTYGENPQREALGSQIEKSYGFKPMLPQLNEVVEI